MNALAARIALLEKARATVPAQRVLDRTTVAGPSAAVELQILNALAEAIMSLGRIPDGIFYAQVMPHFADLAAYNSRIDALVRTGLVRRDGHELVWSGPTF